MPHGDTATERTGRCDHGTRACQFSGLKKIWGRRTTTTNSSSSSRELKWGCCRAQKWHKIYIQIKRDLPQFVVTGSVWARCTGGQNLSGNGLLGDIGRAETSTLLPPATTAVHGVLRPEEPNRLQKICETRHGGRCGSCDTVEDVARAITATIFSVGTDILVMVSYGSSPRRPLLLLL